MTDRSSAGTRVRLVPTCDALALVALGLLVALAVAWSVFGEVRVGVSGAGILLRPETLTAAGGVDPADSVLAGLLDPDLNLRRSQAATRLATVLGRDAAADALRAQELTTTRASLARRIEELDARVAALEDLAGRQARAEADARELRRTHLADEQRRAEQIAETRERWADQAEADPRLGAASPIDVAEARAEALEARKDAHAAAEALAALSVETVEAAS